MAVFTRPNLLDHGMSLRRAIQARMQRFILVLVGVTFVLLIAWLNRPASDLQAYRHTNLPFGCIPFPNHGYAVQDFAYNLLYLRGIEARVVAHPYRQADQETLIRHQLPSASSGMSHAYSPVALVLAQPFLALPPASAYVAYSLLCACAWLLMYRFNLLPRTHDRLQIYLLLVCAINVTTVTAFAVGQTALMTTPILAGIWFLLRRDETNRSAISVIALGALTWALCLKPSFAMIPLTLLLGARAWRALGVTALLLATTWLVLAPLYGGWWNGLLDYSALLNHYYEAGMSPFMRDVFTRHGDTGANAYFSTLFPGHSGLFFTSSRVLYLLVAALLVGLRLSGRIGASLQLRAMIWNFLLLCPYLLPSEDCIMCLLVVEGLFFRSWEEGPDVNQSTSARRMLVPAAKLVLMIAIMNLRAGLTFPGQINFPLKCVLLLWMVIEHLRWTQDEETFRERTQSP